MSRKSPNTFQEKHLTQELKEFPLDEERSPDLQTWMDGKVFKADQRIVSTPNTTVRYLKSRSAHIIILILDNIGDIKSFV